MGIRNNMCRIAVEAKTTKEGKGEQPGGVANDISKHALHVRATERSLHVVHSMQAVGLAGLARHGDGNYRRMLPYDRGNLSGTWHLAETTNVVAWEVGKTRRMFPYDVLLISCPLPLGA